MSEAVRIGRRITTKSSNVIETSSSRLVKIPKRPPMSVNEMGNKSVEVTR